MLRALKSHRVEYVVRTTYTTAVTLILVHFFSWGYTEPLNLTYVSALLAPVSSVIHFGTWQLSAYTVLYSCAIGAGLGVLVGFSYKWTSAHFILFFIALVLVNRCSFWDSRAKVFGSLSLSLGSLLPVLTSGAVVGIDNYRIIIAIILVPWFITGATILFPVPSLALTSGNERALSIANNLSMISVAITKAFFVPDFSDVYLTETDTLYSESLANLVYLKEIMPFISAEVTLFSWLYPQKEILRVFVEVALKLISEFKELQEAVADFVQYEAQENFIKELESPLLALDDFVDKICSAIVQYFTSPSKTSFEVLRTVLISSSIELGIIQKSLLKSFKQWRSQFLVKIYIKENKNCLESTLNCNWNSHHVSNIVHTNYEYLEISSRGTYVYRLKIIANLLISFEVSLIWNFPGQSSIFYFLTHPFITTKNYLESVRAEFLEIATIFKNGIHPNFCTNVILPYIQPTKIAASMILTSTLVLVDSLRAQIPNGFWATTVISLIRQDNTSSSYLIGFQRAEGTVVGAVVAFTLYQLLQCTPEAALDGTALCGFAYTTPILSAWIFFCSFFREDPRHGYAAVVAGFTPILLLLGPSLANPLAAWQRVEMTIVGIFVYLLVDNLIFPTRSDVSLRENLAKSLDLTLSSVSAVKTSVEDLKNQNVTVISREYVQNLSQLILDQKAQLKLAANEPELWFAPFPIVQFNDVNITLQDVLRSLEKTTVALTFCHETLADHLNMRDQMHVVDADIQRMQKLLDLIISICKESEAAVSEAAESVRLVYGSLAVVNIAAHFRVGSVSSITSIESDVEMHSSPKINHTSHEYRSAQRSITFSGLIALQKVSQHLSDDYDRYFREVYMKKTDFLNYDMELLIEVFTICFGMFHIVPKLKSFGRALNGLYTADRYYTKEQQSS